MSFHPRQKKVNVNVPLSLENTVIKQVTETKFLGVLIDQHLSWKPHIDFVSQKILKSVGIIAKAHFYLSFQTLMTVHYSLVYPFLTYCNVAWSFTYCSNLHCIYFLQKRLVRLITKAHYLANKPLYLASLKSSTYLVLIHFLSLLLCILITIIFCLVAFVTCSK